MVMRMKFVGEQEAKFLGAVTVAGKQMHRWRCFPCKQRGRPQSDFEVPKDRDNKRFRCRECDQWIVLRR